MAVKIIISEASGLLQSEFGMLQAPLASYIEKHADIQSSEEKIWDRIFDTRDSKHYAEGYSYETEMDDMVPVGESGDYPTTGYQEGYPQTIHNMTFKQSFGISMEAIEDSVLTDMKRKADKMIRGYHRSKSRLRAAAIGNALQGNSAFSINGFAFPTTCMDGQVVFSTAHPRKVKTGNQSNLYAAAFSADNLFKLKLKHAQLQNDDGETMALHPNIILIPSYNAALVAAVLQAVGTPKVTGSANNDINPVYGDFEVLISDYLNDYVNKSATNPPWILFDEAFNKENNGNIFQKRTELTVKSEIAANDDNIWKARARHGIGFVDFRQMIAGGVTGGSTL